MRYVIFFSVVSFLLGTDISVFAQSIQQKPMVGKISNLSMASEAGNICRVKLSEVRVSGISSNGKEIPFKKSDNYIEFNTRPGQTYIFKFLDLKLISINEQPIIKAGDPGTEDIKFGFEGGTCRKVNGVYYLFTTEVFDEPKTAAVRLAIWKSSDGLKFQKHNVIVETNRNWEDTTHRMSPWAPNTVFDSARNVWSVFHVAYSRKPNSTYVFNMTGRIFRYDSSVKGMDGIGGPYVEGGWLNVDRKPEWWEGPGEIVSFYPYQIGNEWWAFYGGNSVPDHVEAKAMLNPNAKNIFYAGLMKSKGGLTDKWERQSELSPVLMDPEFIENSVVTKIAPNLYVNLTMEPISKRFHIHGQSMEFIGAKNSLSDCQMLRPG